MSHYKSNLRDIEFNLFEVFGRDEVLGPGRSPRSTSTPRARSCARSTGWPATSSPRRSRRRPQPAGVRPGDHTGHDARVVQEVSYQAYMDAEYWRLDLPAELGGTAAPPSLRWASPRWSSAPTRRSTCTPAARRSRTSSAPQRHRARQADRPAHDRARWGATMVLTEPDAGSDVGAGRTKAMPAADGTWHIEGVKRFITSAEHDLTENIVHLVLARPRRRGRRRPGTKGLSPVHRAEVPLRPRDRRADRRAQRRLRHQRRAQDGHQGLHDLRAHLRRGDGPGRRAGCSARCTTASRRCSR